MPAAPIATAADLGAFVGEDIADGNARAEMLLRMASNLVRSHTGTAWGESDNAAVPEAVSDVVIDVAARMWFNPEGLIGDGVDDYRRQWSESAADGMYLTAANRAMLAPHVKSKSTGLRTIATERGDLGTSGTIYVPTGPPPSGYPFPWYEEPM